MYTHSLDGFLGYQILFFAYNTYYNILLATVEILLNCMCPFGAEGTSSCG